MAHTFLYYPVVTAPLIIIIIIINRGGFHSIALQDLVDHQNQFLSIYVGWPGSMRDAWIFSNSEVFIKGQSGMLTPNTVRIIGVSVPVSSWGIQHTPYCHG